MWKYKVLGKTDMQHKFLATHWKFYIKYCIFFNKVYCCMIMELLQEAYEVQNLYLL